MGRIKFNTKGVHREKESEGSWIGNILTYGKISGLTNRNHIEDHASLLIKPKTDNYTESCMANVADGWKERNVWYPGRPVRYALKEITIVENSAERT